MKESRFKDLLNVEIDPNNEINIACTLKTNKRFCLLQMEDSTFCITEKSTGKILTRCLSQTEAYLYWDDYCN